MTTFKPNPLLEKELAADMRERKALLPAARAVAAQADQLAHSAMPRKGRRPIEVVDVNGEVAVANTNHGAHFEEFGMAHTPMYAPLRRGVVAAGLSLREP